MFSSTSSRETLGLSEKNKANCFPRYHILSVYCRCPLFAGNGDVIIFSNNKWIFFKSCYQNVTDILFLEKRKTTQ